MPRTLFGRGISSRVFEWDRHRQEPIFVWWRRHQEARDGTPGGLIGTPFFSQPPDVSAESGGAGRQNSVALRGEMVMQCIWTA